MSSARRVEMPTSVKVGAVDYCVTQDADDWLRIEHSSQTKGYYGHTRHVPPTIYLNPELEAGVQRLTLWHEVLHAVFESVMGAPDWRGLGADKEARDETVIRMIESPTLLVLRDNPVLAAFLTDGA